MTKYEARRTLAATIADHVRDPAGWLLALRDVVERADLDVTRCLPTGSTTLDEACLMVIDFAAKMDRVDALLVTVRKIDRDAARDR